MNMSLEFGQNATNTTEISYQLDEVIILCAQVSICAIAVVAHSCVVGFTLKSEAAKNTASYIIASVSLAEAVLSLYWGIWFPLTFLMHHPLGTREGTFTTVIWFGTSDNFDILLSFNRYIATVKPIAYQHMFSPNRIKFLVVAMWIAACVCCIPYGIPGCRVIVDFTMYHVTYEHTTCGTIIEFGSEVFASGALVATVFNMLTFIMLRQKTKSVSKAIADKEARRRLQREITFFVQSCVTSTTTTLIVLFCDYISLAFHDKWSLYVTTNLIPLMLLAIDGVTVLLLSGSIRKTIAKKFSPMFPCLKGRPANVEEKSASTRASNAWK